MGTWGHYKVGGTMIIDPNGLSYTEYKRGTDKIILTQFKEGWKVMYNGKEIFRAEGPERTSLAMATKAYNKSIDLLQDSFNPSILEN